MLESQARELLHQQWVWDVSAPMERLVRSYDRFLFVVAKHGLFGCQVSTPCVRD